MGSHSPPFFFFLICLEGFGIIYREVKRCSCGFISFFSNRHHEPRKISLLVLSYPYLILTSFGQYTACGGGGILYCTQFCGDLPFVFFVLVSTSVGRDGLLVCKRKK